MLSSLVPGMQGCMLSLQVEMSTSTGQAFGPIEKWGHVIQDERVLHARLHG